MSNIDASGDGKEMAKTVLAQVECIKEARQLASLCCGETYFTGQPREEVFWRTHMGNRFITNDPAVHEYGACFQVTMDP